MVTLANNSLLDLVPVSVVRQLGHSICDINNCSKWMYIKCWSHPRLTNWGYVQMRDPHKESDCYMSQDEKEQPVELSDIGYFTCSALILCTVSRRSEVEWLTCGSREVAGQSGSTTRQIISVLSFQWWWAVTPSEVLIREGLHSRELEYSKSRRGLCVLVMPCETAYCCGVVCRHVFTVNTGDALHDVPGCYFVHKC